MLQVVTEILSGSTTHSFQMPPGFKACVRYVFVTVSVGSA